MKRGYPRQRVWGARERWAMSTTPELGGAEGDPLPIILQGPASAAPPPRTRPAPWGPRVEGLCPGCGDPPVHPLHHSVCHCTFSTCPLPLPSDCELSEGRAGLLVHPASWWPAWLWNPPFIRDDFVQRRNDHCVGPGCC